MPSLTSSQASKIMKHANFVWLKERAGRGEVLDATTVEMKLTVAIEETFPKQNRTTDGAIEQLATAAGADWGSFYVPDMIVVGEAHIDAAPQLKGTDKLLAKALRSVFAGTGGGRSSPDSSLEHIHIGGVANRNLVFDPASRVVLGIVDFHMESGMNKGQKKQVENVEGRLGGTTTKLQVRGNTVSGG